MKLSVTTTLLLMAPNLQWNMVMKNFEVQWKALKECKNNDSPEMPKITKSFLIIKWGEALEDILSCKIGNRTLLLVYVICHDPTPPFIVPVLAAGQPHSAGYGSVEAELIVWASHSHVLYHDNNSDLYSNLEEATQGILHAVSIKVFQ